MKSHLGEAGPTEDAVSGLDHTRALLWAASTIGTIAAVVADDWGEAARTIPPASVDRTRVVVIAADAGAQGLCATKPFLTDEREGVKTTLELLLACCLLG